MSRRAEWNKQAVKELTRLDSPTRQRLVLAVKALCEEGRGDVRRLQGVEDLFRLRVGGWRVIFSFKDQQTILVRDVRPRGDAYKK